LVDGKGTSLGQSLFVALDLSDEERRALLHHGDAFSALLRRNLVTGATTVLRRSLLAYALPVPAPWIHDEWLAVIAAAVGSVSAVDDQLIDYRQHGTNQIGATKLTLGQKVGRLFEHRGNRYSYLVDRAAVLAERMLSMSDTVGAARIEQAGEKLAHQRVRAGLPAARVRRIAAVLREARTGRYGRFSRGSADVLRDLLQPA
jgi:hypothetical protein